MGDEIKLEIVGLVFNQGVVNTYGLVMQEEEGNRRFSVMIGEPEAQSIALKMNNKVLARPLTHDLIKVILTTLGSELKKVVIYDLVNEIFYSELYIENKEGKIFVIDARTSDAVALAVRSDCPVYIKKNILEIVGTPMETEDLKEEKSFSFESLDNMAAEEVNLFSTEDLDAFLERAVKEEKYELAIKLRNALQHKKNSDM